VDAQNLSKIATVKKDTIIPLNDSILLSDMLKNAQNPKTDSISTAASVKKEPLADIITHTADDFIRQDFINNRITLHNNAYIKYQNVEVKAGEISIDYKLNKIFAKGIKDSIGYQQIPWVKQGKEESKQDSILLNYKTEKALVWGLKSEQSDGMFVSGSLSKKENDSTIYIRKIRITTSKKDKPDYYLQIDKAKLVPNKKIVAGPTQLYIADVPTPAILPFAYFPLEKERTSGFLIPSWGENRSQGYFLQNGGYYFALNDYIDLAVLGDIYSNGSWGLRAESSYLVRYRYNGNFNFRYENLINGLRGFPEYGKTSNFNLRWSHNQDQKASPNSRVSASVNLGSSKYYRESLNEYNTNAFLNNTLSSSISYYQNFVGTPFNMTASATHSQNTNTESITMSLPSLQVGMDRLYPFTKDGAQNNAIQKIGLSYGLRADNRINTTDDLFLKKGMFEGAQSGMQHDVSLSTNMRLLNYFTLSPSVNYKEVWYLKSINKQYDPTIQKITIDTLSGFAAFREYSGGVSMSTTVYGMFNFKKGRMQAIRHTMNPSISYGYSPDFKQYYEKVQQTADPNDFIEFTKFEGGIYGAPGRGISNSMGFNLSNTFEAKVKEKDSTKTEFKKIMLLNSLNFSTNYNFESDSLRWSPVNFSGGTSFFDNKLTLNFGGTLDPYALDENYQRINTFNVKEGGGLFRLTNGNMSMNYSFSSDDFKKDKNKPAEGTQPPKRELPPSDELFGENIKVSNSPEDESKEPKKAELYKAIIPWKLTLAYTMNYSNNRGEREISSNSLMFSGDAELTPKWSVGASSGYDFKNKGFTYTQLRFQRDLDSWRMSFNWVPFGNRQTYYFYIGVKSSILSDLKYDKRQVPDQKLF
jgi:lipopolysaccharide assembly outer membrane protein LptD (OstA)